MIGREASPTACVIDSQSVKGAEKGELTGIFGDGVVRRRFGCGVFAVRRHH
jgi:hypothetical protein